MSLKDWSTRIGENVINEPAVELIMPGPGKRIGLRDSFNFLVELDSGREGVG